MDQLAIELRRFIEEHENQAATASLTVLLSELRKAKSDPSIVKTLWDGLLAAIPALAQMPAAIAFATSFIPRG